jgi:hypothetical protein
MRKSITLLLGITMVLALACSSPSTDVASIDKTEATTVAVQTSSDDSSIQTDEEKVLEFTQCIRDQGIEIQDATVDSDGNLQPPRPVEGASTNFQELRPAFEKCRESLDGMTFGRERVDVNEQIDDLLEVTECLRDAGFDLDDPNQENLREWRGQFDFEDPALQKAFEECGRLGRGQSGGGPGSGPPNGRNSGPARGNGR